MLDLFQQRDKIKRNDFLKKIDTKNTLQIHLYIYAIKLNLLKRWPLQTLCPCHNTRVKHSPYHMENSSGVNVNL